MNALVTEAHQEKHMHFDIRKIKWHEKYQKLNIDTKKGIHSLTMHKA